MEITTMQVRNRYYVAVNGDFVGIMERSPFSGEFCYGLLHETRTTISYQPPFTPTRCKTVKAAAKVVAAAAPTS